MMLTPAMKSKSLLQQEIHTASRVPYAAFVDDATLETKQGHLLQIIRVEGLYAETLDDDAIDVEKQIRAMLWMALTDSSNSFYFHTVRKKIDAAMNGVYPHPFLQALHDRYQQQLATKDFYINEHTITVIKKPPVGKIRKVSDVFHALTSSFDRAERTRYRADRLAALHKTTQHILTSLKKYRPTLLTNVYCDKKKCLISPALSFLSQLLNLEARDMVAPTADIASILPFKRLFFDESSGTMAISHLDRKNTYAAILAIKNYAHLTRAGLLDALQDMRAEFIIAQSFNPLEKEVIRNKVKEHQRNSEQSDDGQTSASHQISQVLDAMGSFEATLGEHHFSLLCHAGSARELDQRVADMEACLADSGIIALREESGLKPAFFAMLPGNHAYVTRNGLINTHNIAALASLHNVNTGKKTGNFWGDAITVLETLSGSAFHFNFHVLDVANIFMIGSMGTGKTLTEAFLLSQSMKAGGRLIVFDKDRGLELFIRAQGGTYRTLTPGKPTGFAPFQMEDTEENRFFLVELLRGIAEASGARRNHEMISLLHQTVAGAFQLPQHERILRNIVPFLGMRGADSLRAYFDAWVNDGHYAWIFDHEIDAFSLDAPAIGFEMGAIIENPTLSGVIYHYLFHRVEMLLDGTPTRIVGAEAWRALDDEVFRHKIKEWSSTPRKKNAFLILDTQVPSDIAKSDIGRKIIQESVTQIYFANNKANKDEYCGAFQLSQKEFDIVKSLQKDARYFLLKQGKHSHIVRLDLTGLEDEMSVLSGNALNLKLFDHMRVEKGDDLFHWLPDWYQAVREGRAVE
jgi:type IV secretion system protein VirB4